MVKVLFNNNIIAEADKSSILMIEGNMYFPPSSIKAEYFNETGHHTTCPWKGLAHYYTISVDSQSSENAAWFYPVPKEGSNEIIREDNNKPEADFSNYVAFYTNKVEIVED